MAGEGRRGIKAVEVAGRILDHLARAQTSVGLRDLAAAGRMPSFNQAPFLAEAVESVFAQGIDRLELVVMVDLAQEIDRIDHRELRRELQDILAKARDHLAEDDNFPRLVKGRKARIADRPPLIYHFTSESDARHQLDARRVLDVYEKRLPPDRLLLVDRYKFKDIAFKVVGVGSVGTFCAIGLYMCGDGTPLFLQLKEAGTSVLERLGPKFKGHQGQRVVEGQRVMQAASDIFLGWTEDTASRRQFYVGQLKNRRLGSISDLVEGEALASYACLCGRTLARAHARSADPAVLAGYMGRSGVLDDALASFAMAYAVRTEQDYHRLLSAKRGGRRKAA